jgi:hypothetical protein
MDSQSRRLLAPTRWPLNRHALVCSAAAVFALTMISSMRSPVMTTRRTRN